MIDQPIPFNPGRNGRWVKLGHVSVDGANIMICDPGYATAFDYESYRKGAREVTDQLDAYNWCNGVGFMAGFGDGRYDVWGWVAEYNDGSGWADERIAQVRVTLIDDNAARDWASE